MAFPFCILNIAYLVTDRKRFCKFYRVSFTDTQMGMSEEKRLNEIIRVRKCQNNFVMMDKTFLEDTRLSYKAKGTLAYLLSKPDDWKVIIGNLINNSKDSKKAIYAGLKDCGYYKKVPIRDEKGRKIIRWESTIYEVPELPEMLETTENSGDSLFSPFVHIQNEDIQNVFIQNVERNNNYINNINKTKNNSQSCPVSQKKEEVKTEPSKQTRQTSIS